jgi:hypothetical protein
MERAAPGHISARLPQLDSRRLRQRNQRHLLLQPLDLGVRDARHAAPKKKLDLPVLQHCHVTITHHGRVARQNTQAEER